MKTDKETIRILQFRSDAPRFKGEGIYVFALLEPAEQKLPESDWVKLPTQAYIGLIKEEGRVFRSAFKAFTPLAYKLTKAEEADWEYLTIAYEVEPEDATKEDKYIVAKLHVYKHFLVYFDYDGLRTLPEIAISDWTKF